MCDKGALVRAGVPGMYGEEVDGEHHYPSTTSDFVKLLREQGFTVEYQHERSARTVVSHKALDLWIPILDFTMNVAANVPANIVATLIMNYFRGMRQDVNTSVLHVKYLMRDKDGNVVKFEADGPGSEVLEAMKEFDRDARE